MNFAIGSPGSENSAQDSSASALLFKSQSFMVALVLSMTVQILCVSNLI